MKYILLFTFLFQIYGVAETSLEAEKNYEEGVKLLKQKKRRKARAFFTKAIELDPNFLEARLKRNIIEDWRHLVERESDVSSLPYYRLGEFYLGKKNFEAAEALLKKGSLIDKSGVIKIEFFLNSEPINDISLKNTIFRMKYMDDKRFYFTSNKLYIYSIKSAEPEEAYFEIKYNKHGTESSTAKPYFTDLQEGELLEVESVELNSVTTVQEGVSLSNLVLEGEIDHSGVKITLNGTCFENKGFEYITQSDKEGQFDLFNITSGKLKMKFEKDGYMSFDVSVTVKEDSRILVEDKFSTGDKIILPNHEDRIFYNSGRSSHPYYDGTDEVPKYELHETVIKLYKKPAFKMLYQLEEEGLGTFLPSVKQVPILDCSPADFNRGSWSRNESDFNFKTGSFKSRWPDIVVYKTHKGFYLGRPNFKKPLFITQVEENFDQLQAVPQILMLRRDAALELGRTYILTCHSEGDKRFVKVMFVELEENE